MTWEEYWSSPAGARTNKKIAETAAEIKAHYDAMTADPVLGHISAAFALNYSNFSNSCRRVER